MRGYALILFWIPIALASSCPHTVVIICAKINYNERKKTAKKKKTEKAASELVFPIFRTVKPSFRGGFNENTDSRYNMY